MLKKVKEALKPKAEEAIPQGKVYKFKVHNNEGEVISERTIEEKDLTLGQMNIIYKEFIANFQNLPEKVKSTFIEELTLSVQEKHEDKEAN